MFTGGIQVPGGVFAHSLLAGAALGRIVGYCMNVQLGIEASEPGVYAVVGAIAMLAGNTRGAISLPVIMVEATGRIDYALYLTSASFCATFVGNAINRGIYETQIDSKKLPFLKTDAPENRYNPQS